MRRNERNSSVTNHHHRSGSGLFFTLLSVFLLLGISSLSVKAQPIEYGGVGFNLNGDLNGQVGLNGQSGLYSWLSSIGAGISGALQGTLDLFGGNWGNWGNWGSGYGTGYGSGSGYGNGLGNGYGTGYGNGYGSNQPFMNHLPYMQQQQQQQQYGSWNFGK